jgi:hypothetical protein
MLANRTTFGARTTFAYRFEFEEAAAEIFGTLAGTEGADTAAISGNVIVVGALSGTEGADAGAFTGAVIVNGNLSGTDGADAASFAGQAIVSGSLSATDGADAASFDGTAEGAEPQPEPVIIEGGGGGEYYEHRWRHYKSERERLKQAIRASYRKVTGEPEIVPVTRREERKIKNEVVKRLRTEGIRFDGLDEIQAVLADVGALMRDYDTLQAELKQREINDNDALAILLLVA